MAYYESIWIARQDISTQQVEELAAQLGQILTERGGEIASQEYWGLKNLSYRIKKNRKGHYVLFNLNAPADAVQEYERVMRLNEDVMRYLTVRVPELSSEPSAMLRDRGERDRGGRGGRGGGRYGDRDRGDRPGGDRPGGDRGGDRPGGDRGERRERREGDER